MRFVHQGHGAIKLSNLRISDWNGKLEEKSTNAPPAKEDLANLVNGDKVSGKLESFRDGKLSFSLRNSKLEIPLGRVGEVQFANENVERASDSGANVRAFFSGGGSVTFQLERWDNQGAVATSPNFGRATFVPSAFERVELHSKPDAKQSL
jgi:hypothetical protein